MKIEMVKIDLKTGKRTVLEADVQAERDEAHTVMTLTYEGYRTAWHETEGK